MLARAEYNAIQNCMNAVEEQPTAYDVENMISEVEVKMKAMWYFLDCHSAQCDNESGGDCGYCKKDFYDEIDKIVEQLKNELEQSLTILDYLASMGGNPEWSLSYLRWRS